MPLTNINDFIEKITDDIKLNQVKGKYTVNAVVHNTKKLKYLLRKVRGGEVLGAHINQCTHHGISAFERSHMQSQYAKLELEITTLTSRLKLYDGTLKLYDSLKSEYEVLYGRYEMLRVQYVRIRTKKMVSTPPAFIAGRGHPCDPSRRYISNLGKLRDTKKILRAQQGEPQSEEDGDDLSENDDSGSDALATKNGLAPPHDK